MTLKEYNSREIFRPIHKFEAYEVSNRGKVRNATTKQILNPTGRNCYVLFKKGKCHVINVYKEIMRSFQDVIISDYMLAKLSKSGKRIRGVYTACPNKNGNRYRVIIQKKLIQHYFGVYKTYDDAKRVAIRNYMLLNRIK